MRPIAAALFTFATLPLFAGELRPPSKGLDGGKGGHWGEKNDAHWVDGRWNQTDIGPFMTCTLPLAGQNINSAINLRFNGDIKGGACFDAAACGLRAAWTGGFLTFSGKRYGVIENPKPNGELLLKAPTGDLWSGQKVHFGSIGVYGNLRYNVGSTKVGESCNLLQIDGKAVLVRRLIIYGTSEKLTHAILHLPNGKVEDSVLTGTQDGKVTSFTVIQKNAPLFERSAGEWSVELQSGVQDIQSYTLLYTQAEAGWLKERMGRVGTMLEASKTSTPLWTTEPVTRIAKTAEAQGLAFDDIPLPLDNPYKALFFCTGLDFFPDGTAALCTLHGDVWLAHGLANNGTEIKWHRFATGMYQPLGLKIVDGKIHVVCRDQITRLEDRNQDGEADQYVAFNRNPHISLGTHDYVACLDTDRAGNFYFVGPKGLHRVSKNGQQHEIIATGWRNPIAMSVGPNDEILVAPQEGEWTPASMLYVAKPNGYYGYPGPKITPERPLGYDAPLCYMPRLMDNSSGGQVWLSGEKWGALKGLPLNLSFGRSAMQFIHADGPNGALVPVNYRFPSGVCRGAINPVDGHLYIVGTQGWATNAALDGCFVRVRRTEKPLLFPSRVKTFATGVQLTFENELNKEDAEDPGSYQVEAWNCKYAAKYGSEEFSIAQPDKKGHDEWTVKAAKLSADQKSVFLEIEEFQPAHQIQIQGRLNLKSGERIALDTALTIRELPTQKAP